MMGRLLKGIYCLFQHIERTGGCGHDFLGFALYRCMTERA